MKINCEQCSAAGLALCLHATHIRAFLRGLAEDAEKCNDFPAASMAYRLLAAPEGFDNPEHAAQIAELSLTQLIRAFSCAVAVSSQYGDDVT